MIDHTIATREAWLAAREQLLEREKEHTRLGDELARQRRELPWVRVEKNYRFDTDEGTKTLVELFDGRSQLLVYHFMFGPSYAAGCPVNSSIADAVNGVLPHLHARDLRFVFVSQAPLEKLQAYKRRMGWSFPWVSSAHTDFNFDLGFSHTEEHGRAVVEQMMGGGIPPIAEQNARAAGTDLAGYLTESPGFSAFANDNGTVYQAYSTTWRGLEFLMSYYPIFDHAPRGREEGEDWQLWIRRHESTSADDKFVAARAARRLRPGTQRPSGPHQNKPGGKQELSVTAPFPFWLMQLDIITSPISSMRPSIHHTRKRGGLQRVPKSQRPRRTVAATAAASAISAVSACSRMSLGSLIVT